MWDSSLLLDETGNQISIKIRCREDLVSPSHHLKSADHWLLLSSSLCLQSYCERIFSPSQSCRAPDILLWSPITRTASVPGQWSAACQCMCVRSCCCCFFLFCLREFQIACDFLMDSVGEGEGGKIWENGIETCVISCMKLVASPGSMHDTGCLGLVHWDNPEGWCGEGGLYLWWIRFDVWQN